MCVIITKLSVLICMLKTFHLKTNYYETNFWLIITGALLICSPLKPVKTSKKLKIFNSGNELQMKKYPFKNIDEKSLRKKDKSLQYLTQDCSPFFLFLSLARQRLLWISL